MSNFLNGYKIRFEEMNRHFAEGISTIKAGRANPSLLDNFRLTVYGSQMSVKELASVFVQETNILLIQPWDKNIIQDIANAIAKSDLGVNPIVQGNAIKIVFPALTEEKRKELVKLLHSKIEDSKIRIRLARDEAQKEVKRMASDKEIAEDEMFRLKAELQKLVDDANNNIQSLGDKKESELLK